VFQQQWSYPPLRRLFQAWFAARRDSTKRR
jgi:hypothetical protein